MQTLDLRGLVRDFADPCVVMDSLYLADVLAERRGNASWGLCLCSLWCSGT